MNHLGEYLYSTIVLSPFLYNTISNLSRQADWLPDTLET